MNPTTTSPLSLTHRPWTASLGRPAMANQEDRHTRIGLTTRYLERDGAPYIPVSGEFHFSRVPRRDWARRLRAMRAGGITTVATYVFWIHHQPQREVPPDFAGHLDLAAFVDLCAAHNLDVVLRIGPWCHGEVRNGGFPDWVQDAPVQHRTDDPAYLALVRGWFTAIAAQLPGRFGDTSCIIGIQLENEIYDQPQHIVTLKQMARDCGMTAPLWMSTGWGSAELPPDEVLPMYGGYADGFWVDADADWDPTFREHFFFSHVWDDPGIGADILKMNGGQRSDSRGTVSARFPPVTCELGGGMATAYHRRPLLSGADIAAVANAKIGNGSAWQGYYMYVGGTNPGPGLQESQATGYPNDMPEFDYDFHAPIGASGRLNDTHAMLRRQHAFLAAVGDRLATMPSSLPDLMPRGVQDTEVLRWAVRSDGTSGFVFINWHQPHEPLHPLTGVTFDLQLGEESLRFPDQPTTILPGTLARWPFRLAVGNLTLQWATASLLTLLDRPGGGTVAVLTAEPGTAVAIALEDGTVLPSPDGRVFVHADGDDAVVVLPVATADLAWVMDGTLYLSADELDADDDGVTTWVRTPGPPPEVFDTGALHFVSLTPSDPLGRAHSGRRPVAAEQLQTATPPPSEYGAHQGRASAPGHDILVKKGAAYRLHLPEEAAGGSSLELEIDWVGDVAALEVDGEVVADQFWDGTLWTVDLGPADDAPREVILRVLPLHHEAQVWLDPSVRRKLPADPQEQGLRSAAVYSAVAMRHGVAVVSAR
ncbi:MULTISPECIES: beta-galactosidase [unclassified Arthrobacter]|uniref:beta-galactosidase n=1 Tax=unclassified Arthrobacter TaxID=235627 RepID=UPI001490A0FA|nr:beta-galactosidase [Arthrobacter sp. AET 35A]NOJ64346.1 beta-galactosidase [Arthrobacter sp. 147(2020)]